MPTRSPLAQLRRVPARLRTTVAAVVVLGSLSVVGMTATAGATPSDPGDTPAAGPSAPAARGPLTVAQARQQVTRLQIEAASAGENANALGDQVTTAARRVQALDKAVTQQQTAVRSQQRAIGALVLATYQAGGVSPSTRLIFSSDPAALLQQGATAQSVTDQQASSLRQLQQARAKLSDLQSGQRTELAGLQQLRVKEKAQQQDLTTKLAEAKAILARLTVAQRRQLAQQQAIAAAAAAQHKVAPNLPSAPSAGAAKAVKFALAQLGAPYVWGAAGPSSYDCSGLTMRAWETAGVSLPHSSREQIGYGRQVSQDELQPGDLIFYYHPISHVAIYIGNGEMVQAPHPGADVEVSPAFGQMPFAGAARPA